MVKQESLLWSVRWRFLYRIITGNPDGYTVFWLSKTTQIPQPSVSIIATVIQWKYPARINGSTWLDNHCYANKETGYNNIIARSVCVYVCVCMCLSDCLFVTCAWEDCDTAVARPNNLILHTIVVEVHISLTLDFDKHPVAQFGSSGSNYYKLNWSIYRKVNNILPPNNVYCVPRLYWG